MGALSIKTAKVLVTLIASSSFLANGGPIAQPAVNKTPPAFYGTSVSSEPLSKTTVDHNPYLAEEGVNGMHGNTYNTDTYDYAGPLGKNPVVKSRSLNTFGGLAATTVFDSKGRLICISGGLAGFKLLLLDPDSLEVLASTTLPQRKSTEEFFRTLDFDLITSDTSGGAYFHLLDGDRPLIGNSENVLQIYKVDDRGRTPVWTVEREYDLQPYLTSDETITDAIPDWTGRIWFITRQGTVGTVDPETEKVRKVRLKSEEIQNTLAVAKDGTYIVSDHAMYRYKATRDGSPKEMWRKVYDRGSTLKPGAINQGSGTAPTLLDVPVTSGKNKGKTVKTVAVTDNADGKVNLLVYNRKDGSLIVKQPLFTEGKSVSENSIVANGRSFIIENNYSEHGAGFLSDNPESEPGITRVDLNSTVTGGKVVWTSKEASPTVVAKLSTGSGLLYAYTRVQNKDIDEDTVAWYFTAIDFKTGKTKYKVFTGTGINWNNSYAPITIGPNGNAYVGVFNGIISIADTK